MNAITDSSGRIQDEPATVQPQDSIFQMTEAELHDSRLHINDIFLFQPQVRPPPEEPQTLPRPSYPRPLTAPDLDEFTDSSGRLTPSPETHRVDSSGRIQDEPATVQPQDSIFQMTEAELDEFREDSSGMLHINDIFLSQGLEPPILFQPQDVPPTEEPATLPRPDEFRESSGRLDINDIFLAQGPEPPIPLQQVDVPPPEEPQTLPRPSNPRPLTAPDLDEFTDSSGRLTPSPEESQTLPRPSIRPLSQAELDEFRDSSGRIDVRAIFLSQGLEPPILLQQLENNRFRTPSPEEPETLPRPSIRPLSQAELDEFRNSSGRIDVRAIFLSQGLEPPILLQQLENNRYRTPPPVTPMGLSEETISKYLKTMNADEFRAHNKDGDRKICAVCLDDVCGQKDIVAILDDCGHEFHYCCLEKWLRRKNLCPLCRGTAISLLGDDR